MRPKKSVISTELGARIDQALAELKAAEADLASLSASASIARRRAAHARLRAAIDNAEAALRAGVDAASGRSRSEWTKWRRQLSRLRTVGQAHLFNEVDDLGVLRIAVVRALDTGMSGPAIGDLQHGKAGPIRTEPRYGLDLDAVLSSRRRPTRQVKKPRRIGTESLDAVA